MPLKPIAEQVVVVTGAASPLGLAVARAAAKAGAAVVLADAHEAAVRRLAAELEASGGRVHPLAADPATEDGCERIGRAAAARFDRIDGWVDATGGEAGLTHAAQGLVRYMAARGGQGGLVAFTRRLPRAAAAELRRGRGRVAPTLIGLPRDWRPDGPTEAAAAAALYALVHPLGRMSVAARGRRLTALTEAAKRRGAVLGVGLLAITGMAVWLGRGKIAAGPERRRSSRRLKRDGRILSA